MYSRTDVISVYETQIQLENSGIEEYSEFVEANRNRKND